MGMGAGAYILSRFAVSLPHALSVTLNIFSITVINLGLAELANGFLLLADFWQHTAAYCLSLQSHESLRNVQDQLTTNTVLNSKPPSPLTQSWQRCNI